MNDDLMEVLKNPYKHIAIKKKTNKQYKQDSNIELST